MQPIQECPGFQCKSGVKKCLPNKRRCDKIIDCLDGEDEIGCIFMRSVNENEEEVLTTTLTYNKINNNTISTSNEESVTFTFLKDIEASTIITESSRNGNLLSENILGSVEKIIESESIKDKNTNQNNESQKRNIYEDATSTTDVTKYESNFMTTKDLYQQNEELMDTEIITKSSLFTTGSSNNGMRENYLNDNDLKIISLTTDTTVNFHADFQQASTIELQNSSDESEKSNLSIEIETDIPSTTTLSTVFLEQLNKNFITTTTSYPTKTIETRSPFEKESPSLRDRTDIPEDEDTVNILNNNKMTTMHSKINPNEFESVLESTTFTTIENNSNNPSFESDISDTSNELVVTLLPKVNLSVITISDNKNEDKSIKDEIVSTSSPNSEIDAAKNLPEVESNKDFVHKMEELLISEVQPAKIRRKHKIPSEFECGR